MRKALAGCEPGTAVGVEATANWYWIIHEIEQAGLRLPPGDGIFAAVGASFSLPFGWGGLKTRPYVIPTKSKAHPSNEPRPGGVVTAQRKGAGDA